MDKGLSFFVSVNSTMADIESVSSLSFCGEAICRRGRRDKDNMREVKTYWIMKKKDRKKRGMKKISESRRSKY